MEKHRHTHMGWSLSPLLVFELAPSPLQRLRPAPPRQNHRSSLPPIEAIAASNSHQSSSQPSHTQTENHCCSTVVDRCEPPWTTKGPAIRTGFVKDAKPVQLKEGQEITISTDYNIKGDAEMISMSYKKLPVDVKPGNTILCADGTISLTVLSCDPAAGTVRCCCQNTAVLGERKNVNLPGVVVDLPTLTEKDKEDILEWGVPHNIDMIALSFVRKGSDLVNVRKVLGIHAKHIQLTSKVENQEGVINFDEI
ncbi:unnamed protein product [Camellia sinensis]